MAQILETVNGIIWGAPTLCLILGVGIFLSIQTKWVQFRLFPRALQDFFRKIQPQKCGSGVSSMQALCTALAATVGTGNIAGVAGAIAIGGPGSIFWMWVCALLGMAVKFAEATLAVRYRTEQNGEYLGGPMYMITQALPKKMHFLAWLYAFFGVFAAFGVGNATQINAVITSINGALHTFGISESFQGNLLMGFFLAVLIFFMLTGGAKRIGRIAEFLVPFAAVAYLGLGLFVLICRYEAIPSAFAMILQGAFSPRAVTGGAIGSFFLALRTGVSRGIFTNEAGMGTASIAHAGANVSHPCQQGLMGIMEVFLDTIVICTMTALVILVSGVPIPYGLDTGAALTTAAFQAVCGDWVSIFMAAALCCFAFATVLGWGLYGLRCATFLFGCDVTTKFALLQGITVVIGSLLKTGTVWMLCESVNGLMAIPNLILLALLAKELARLTIQYKSGGNYESIHQCKPLPAFSHEKVPSPGSKGQGSR